MKNRTIMVLAGLLIGGFLTVRAEDKKQAEAEKYFLECERKWAEAVASGDTAILEEMLSEDFVGIEVDGTFYDKAKAIAATRAEHSDFVSNHMDGAKVRFFGDAAVSQGSETWEKRSGEPRRGRYVWTDVWIKRNGKWQSVAAQDIAVPADTK